ncbi:BTAD domain-containing putative transcriptional regulator [Streptomyces liliifuscus]|uniref:Winged helix-turn-helix domain-containing protein n=1 Tax=Streptomyces liliifuscus TaxID=2797636 RepID=A0A7T7I6U0_9ACTN|nr:BTAD domain-containing putative transcriptional regulator [Streptomyces liliifuscus]QQM41862.1 winged helix-turn-helix domain-containing protein [Streptomyces liliifuscus]
MRYRILGVTQATDAQGKDVPLGGPRLRALLTAMALRAGRSTSPETLIDEVWPDSPSHAAPAALQALVARLRRALGKDAITSEPGGYRLATTPEDVDLFVFERLVREGRAQLDETPETAARTLREALDLWRGPALADLPDRTTAATRPESLRQEATRARVEADLRNGHAHDAVPELRELTETHPYDEPLHALLIRALRDTGRTADALAAYESARRGLADGLGTDPGPELRALHGQLLTPRPAAPAATPSPYTPTTPSRADRTGNIRPRLNSFVGREPELDAIRSELHRVRLVTLTGPGGSGKTRLAEEAAAGHPQAWLAELAPLDRPEAVTGAVVSALGLRETVLKTHEMTVQQDDPVALLIEYCAPRSQLLILDNCEHVIGAAAELAETLLTHCPRLTILATSREPLGVPGESVRPVEPLLPDPAHRLFTERAVAAYPDADVSHDPAAVDEICRRLDGLPLAIELAAARLRMLTPRQIADRLDDRFRLLTSGSRTALPRQQTLRAVVDWSWDLLDEPERTVLRELSVFAGGWDLDAAEAVCTGPVAEIVGALVDKSLVVATPCGRGISGMRYRMLETIHEYAAERAAETPELRATAERRHRAWVRALVEEADPLLRSADQLRWIGRLESDLDNIRAALHRALVAADEPELGSIVLAMGWFWWLRNFRREGATWADQVLRLGTALDRHSAGTFETSGSCDASGTSDASGSSELRDPSRRHTPEGLPDLDSVDPVEAYLADPEAEKGHPSHRTRMKLRVLDLFLRAELGQVPLNDERTQEYARVVRATMARGGPDAARFPGIIWPLMAFVLGNTEGIRDDMERSLANCREHGGDWEIGAALLFRVHVAVDSPGGMDGVDETLAELRAVARRTGDRWMLAQVSSAGGEAAMARSRFDEAKSEFEEAMRLAVEVGAYVETPFLIARLGEIAYYVGDRAEALAALNEATAAADRYAVPDSRAFVLLMRSQMAFDDQDFVRARELHEAARTEMDRGTPPAQFLAALNGLGALLTAVEASPGDGLRKLADTLREATSARCSEVVLATLTERAAGVLSDIDDHVRVVRFLAAGSRWRQGHPRPLPYSQEFDRIEAVALSRLGRPAYDTERRIGATLTPDDILKELVEAAVTATVAATAATTDSDRR